MIRAAYAVFALVFVLSSLILVRAIGSEENVLKQPTTIKECVESLKKTLPASLLLQLKAERPDARLSKYFGTVGLEIRNNYLYGRSKSSLAQLFFKEGIHQPDSMSAIIMVALFNDLHSQPTDIPRLMKSYARSERLGMPEVQEKRNISPELQNTKVKTNMGDFTLKQLKGKVVVLVLFDIQGYGCLEAAQVLDSMCRIHSKSEFQVIGFIDDERYPPEENYKEKFLKRLKAHFPVAIEGPPNFCSEVAQLNVLCIPQIIVIGKDGSVVTYFNGWERNTEQLLKQRVNQAVKTGNGKH